MTAHLNKLLCNAPSPLATHAIRCSPPSLTLPKSLPRLWPPQHLLKHGAAPQVPPQLLAPPASAKMNVRNVRQLRLANKSFWGNESEQQTTKYHIHIHWISSFYHTFGIEMEWIHQIKRCTNNLKQKWIQWKNWIWQRTDVRKHFISTFNECGHLTNCSGPVSM